MHDLSLARIEKITTKFAKRKILVLGDLMLDKYIWGKVSRISPEAPVPVVEVTRESLCLGGAGNVAHNLQALGAQPVLVSLIGQDREGDWILNNVSDSRGIIIDTQRATIVKTRIIAHHQQVVRVDFEQKKPITPEIEEKIAQFLQKESFEGLIISDYNKGLLTPALLKKVLTICQDKNIPVFVDPKVDNFYLFSPVTVITPNHHECAQIVHHPCNQNDEIEAAGQKIMTKIQTKYLIIKRGEKGMTVFEQASSPIHIPTRAREVYDVTGAGDTVIAVTALSLLSGASIQEATFLANLAAGVVVGKIGTAVASIQEITDSLED
ncbi:MAG TPA: D-glycero-beta-D-manno-heptose-7-phosphate kinase [Candidatus Aminicenantes bacterium]|nr:D-glycero-beta-D-manno-heptose-7-phosphate kinase [Candidatus Aminicenantes bacterium]